MYEEWTINDLVKRCEEMREYVRNPRITIDL